MRGRSREQRPKRYAGNKRVTTRLPHHGGAARRPKAQRACGSRDSHHGCGTVDGAAGDLGRRTRRPGGIPYPEGDLIMIFKGLGYHQVEVVFTWGSFQNAFLKESGV